MRVRSAAKRRFVRSLLPLALCTLLLSLDGPAARAAEEQTGSTDELVVEMVPGVGINAIVSELSVLGWEVVVASEVPAAESLGEVALLRPKNANSSSLSSAASALAAVSDVAGVEENVVYGGAQSQVPIYSDDLMLASMPTQSALTEVGLEPPSGASGNPFVLVAVIDGGFDLGVESLSGRILGGFDAIHGDADPEDAGNDVDDDEDGVTDRGVGHGTAVAALIAVAAPECKIFPIQAFDDEGRGTTFALANAIRGAIGVGAKVINISGGASGPSGIVSAALDAAQQADVLVVASAGNDGASAVTFPAANSTVIAVTGVDADRERDPDANVGAAVDLSAFSIDVIAPYPGMAAGYGRWFGTSFSCAAVSAAAARVLQQDPGSPLGVGEALLEAASAYASTESPYDQMGWGVLDVSSLLD
jgi:hypothetical protein